MKLIKIAQEEPFEKQFEESPLEKEMRYEEEMMHTDPTTGRHIHYIKQSDVEKVLDSFIVDTLSGSTLSRRFSLDFEKGSGDPRYLVAMRMVNHPYTRYNISHELRRGIMGALKDYNVGDVQDIVEMHFDEFRKVKTKRPKRNYNPDRPRKTRYPVTKMQEIRDLHGMIGLYDLTKAKDIAKEVVDRYGEFFNKEELDFLKSMALTNAYINIYPERVSVIKGNGKMWVIDDSTYEEMASKGIHPDFS
jgi:hypothetical protein